MQNSKKLLAFIVLAIYGLLFYFFIATFFHLVMLIIGLALGAGFLLIDEAWLHKFYREKDDSDNWLVTRSPLFIVSLIPMTVFIATSTNSYISRGFVLGMYLYLLLEMVQYREDIPAFKERYLQDTDFKVDSQILTRVLGFGFVFFILLNILAIL